MVCGDELQGLESGACCVTALIKGKELVVSNLGDCRAVLSRKGKADALTNDHKASHEDERKRIQDKVQIQSIKLGSKDGNFNFLP